MRKIHIARKYTADNEVSTLRLRKKTNIELCILSTERHAQSRARELRQC